MDESTIKMLLEGFVDHLKNQTMSIDDIVKVMKDDYEHSITADEIKALIQPTPTQEETLPTLLQLKEQIILERKQNSNAGVLFKDFIEQDLDGNMDIISMMGQEGASRGEAEAIQRTMMDSAIRQMEEMGMEKEVLEANMEMFEESINKTIEDAMAPGFKSFADAQHHTSAFFKTKAGQHLADGFNTLKDTMKAHVDTILGDLKSMIIDPMINMGKSLYGFFTDTGEDEQLTWTKKIADRLDKMMGISKEDRLARMREGEGDGDSGGLPYKLIAGALFALGAIIGAVVGKLLLPFKALGFIAAQITPLMNLFSKIGGLTKNIGWIGKLGGVFKQIGGYVKTMIGAAKNMKFLGPFIKGFVKGFTKLALPLQIIMSAVDFFKGFMGSNEDTFIGKIKDGLVGVVTGFIELPVKLLGWVYDWVMEKMFGVEPPEDGSGNKMMDILSGYLDNVIGMFLAPFKAVEVFFKSFASSESDSFIGKLWDGLKGFFKTLIEIPLKILSWIWDQVGGFVSSIGGKLWDGLKGFFKTILMAPMNALSWVGSKIGEFFEGTLIGKIIGDVISSFSQLFESLGKLPGIIWDGLKEKFAGIPFIGKFFGSSPTEETPEGETTKETDNEKVPTEKQKKLRLEDEKRKREKSDTTRKKSDDEEVASQPVELLEGHERDWAKMDLQGEMADKYGDISLRMGKMYNGDVENKAATDEYNKRLVSDGIEEDPAVKKKRELKEHKEFLTEKVAMSSADFKKWNDDRNNDFENWGMDADTTTQDDMRKELSALNTKEKPVEDKSMGMFGTSKPEDVDTTIGGSKPSNKIAEITNAVSPSQLDITNKGLLEAEASKEASRKKSQLDMTKSIQDGAKSSKESSERQASATTNLVNSMTVNNESKEVNKSVPPDDIEQVSLMVMNKQWGF